VIVIINPGVRILLAVATLLVYPCAAQAQLKVIISGGFSSAYEQVLPEFEKSTGITVTTLSGASQGKGPETIAAQLGRGVAADVAILSREGLSELMAAGRIAAGSDVDLARAGLGASVRSGTRKPDISTVAAFKEALLSAKVVAVPGSTSGIYLTTELFPRLGIADKLDTRIMPRASQAVALVASGEANIIVQPISELLHKPGLDFLGPIPAEIQFIQTFAAAIVSGSKEIEASRRLIGFLASERAAAAVRNNGMEPVKRP
jgi:molybdate transport system substrate-binding protein